MKTKQFKYISLIIVTLLVMNISDVQGQEKEKIWQWITSLGSPNWDYVNGIETDSDGNVYIGGAYTGEFSVNKKNYESQGKQDLFVAKYNHKGKMQWVWNAGGNQSDKLTALYATNNDELIVSGIVTGEVKIEKQTLEGEGKKLILAKLTKKGKPEWIKSFPIKSPASMYQIYQNSSGIIVAGTFKKTLAIEGKQVISSGKEDIFIARFSNNGTLENLKAYGSKGKDVITAFEGSETGEIYLSASYQGEITIEQHNLASPGQKVTGAFIAAFNQELQAKWLHAFESQHYVKISAIAPANNNELYVTGNFTHKVQYNDQELISNGAMDFFTAKLDTIGNLEWIKSYGTQYTDYANNIVLNPAGGIMLNGTFNDTLMLDTIQLTAIEGNATAFVSQINANGNVFWAESIGGKTSISSHHSTLDKQGNIFLSGSFTGKIENDKFNIKAEGNEDIYIAKYYNCPEYSEVIQGDSYICPNGEIELKVKGRFDNISWNDGLFTDKKITITEPGTYFVEMIDKNACLVLDTIEVTEAKGPMFDLGNDTFLFTDQSIKLEGPKGMVDYWWYNDITLQSITVTSQGELDQQINVWLQVTDTLNCQFTDSIVVRFEPRSPMINMSQARDFNNYPNPASDFLYWSLSYDQKVSLRVELTNIEGTKVYIQQVYNYIPGQQESIKVSNFPAGNYYLSIGNNTEKITKTVVIVKE